MRVQGDEGVSLVEIVIAIVIMGVVFSALFAALGTVAYSSKSHRELTTADTVMRSYAEATKEAVRTDCSNGGVTYTVDYDPPDGFVPAGAPGNCPVPTAPQTLNLTVAGPNGTTTMQIVVRSR